MSSKLSQDWKQLTLGDLGRVVTGRTPPSSKPELFGDQYPFITPTDMAFSDRSIWPERGISEAGAESLSRIKLPAKTPCFVCIGATIGKLCLTSEESFTNQQINSIVVDKDRHNPEFVYYLLRHISEHVKSLAGGAATPIINKTAFSEVPVLVPSLEMQETISSILSAYDDLIENNTRRIEILEEMARRLYEEWFVHFRFLGHEEVSFKDSKLGRIPEGWEVSPFTDLVDVLSGGTPKKSEERFWGGVIPFFTPKDTPSSAYALKTAKFITEEGLSKCSSQLYPKDTVFITARGTVGKVVLASRDMAMNQSCYALKAKKGFGQLFIFLALRGVVHELKAKSHGAVFDTIIKDTFKMLKLVAPESEVALRFEESVKPIFGLILNLQQKNSNLRAQRDLLLPKLVSGEIDISDIPMPDNKEVEAA